MIEGALLLQAQGANRRKERRIKRKSDQKENCLRKCESAAHMGQSIRGRGIVVAFQTMLASEEIAPFP